MVKLIYQIDENMEDGKPFIVSGRFNATLAERSSLRKHVEAIRGTKLTKEELEDFEMDDLLGTNALLNIVWNESDKGTFANIASAVQYDKRFGDKIEPKDYIRVQDREGFGTES
jgi:hypothetical protein